MHRTDVDNREFHLQNINSFFIRRCCRRCLSFLTITPLAAFRSALSRLRADISAVSLSRLFLNEMYLEMFGKGWWRLQMKREGKISNIRNHYFQSSILLLKTIEQEVLQIIYFTYLSLHIWLDPDWCQRISTTIFLFTCCKSRSLLFTMINCYKNKNSTIGTVFVRLVQKVFLS